MEALSETELTQLASIAETNPALTLLIEFGTTMNQQQQAIFDAGRKSFIAFESQRDDCTRSYDECIRLDNLAKGLELQQQRLQNVLRSFLPDASV
jgi:hypothetical protein